MAACTTSQATPGDTTSTSMTVDTTSTTPPDTTSTTAAATVPEEVGDFGIATVSVGDALVVVWVADTPDTRQQGLMWVEALPDPIQGMLFVFEEPRQASFWMLNTLLSLDIWWFDEEGGLVGMTTMEPCPERPCPNYLSPGPILWALETPAGVFDFAPEESLRFLARHND